MATQPHVTPTTTQSPYFIPLKNRHGAAIRCSRGPILIFPQLSAVRVVVMLMHSFNCVSVSTQQRKAYCAVLWESINSKASLSFSPTQKHSLEASRAARVLPPPPVTPHYFLLWPHTSYLTGTRRNVCVGWNQK